MASLVIGGCLAVYATCVEPFKLVVTNYTVQTSKWNSEKPLKIAVLTDIHAIHPWMTPAHIQEVVDKANSLNPDVVLLLGDFVGTYPFGKQLKPEEGIAPLKNLKSVCGTYAVVGNHDLSGPKGWPEALEAAGIPVLRNDLKELKCNDHSFAVGGLDEFRLGHVDVQKTLAKNKGKAPVIMMTHNPDVFVDVPQSVALTVAGHTHGGQIKLPFIGAVSAVIPSKYGTRFDRGHIQEDGKDLVVSSGLGMTGIPMRFMCPPEITVINLEHSK